MWMSRPTGLRRDTPHRSPALIHFVTTGGS